MTTLPPQQCVRGFAGPCKDRSQPRSIFTDLPQFSCPFTNSPVIASPRHSPPSTSPRMSHNAFPKVHVPTSTWSTDSEILSDIDHRLGSPSLISSMFSRNTGSSCSTSSHATPVTPGGSKPILRRPDCTSASTSASEDGGRMFDGRNGLGLSSLTSSNHPGLTRKRSTLTFAVKCTVTSDLGHSPASSFSRPCRNYSKSPARQLPVWHDDEEDEDENGDDEEGYEYCDALIDEDDESDDEGYQEDEEGGFTDDEDLVGTLTRHASNLWVASARWKARHPSPIISRDGSYISASEDGHIYQPRGRKVSIATSKPDRCSRHVSPPPSRSSSTPPVCPPAARSPSAIGLCRRRETAQSDSRPGSRSDDNRPFGLRPLATCKSPSNSSSLAGPSILRPCTSGQQRAQTYRPMPSTLQMVRRSSAPARSMIDTMGSNETNKHTAQKALEEFVRRQVGEV